MLGSFLVAVIKHPNKINLKENKVFWLTSLITVLYCAEGGKQKFEPSNHSAYIIRRRRDGLVQVYVLVLNSSSQLLDRSGSSAYRMVPPIVDRSSALN